MSVRVLHGVASLAPGHGGPSRTVIGLTDALARGGGASVRLLCQAAPGVEPVPSNGVVIRDDASTKSRLARVFALPLRKRLQQIDAANRPDLVHSHGIWQPANHWLASYARQRRIPLVIQPRGMLDPWALEQKRYRKLAAMALFQQRELAAAAALVASSERELESIRRFRLSQPVAVIPNGTVLPSAESGDPASLSVDRTRVALFLSRVHPQKGTLELVRAWAKAAPAGWRLMVAGPDDQGHWSEVARLADQLGIRNVIDYIGPVDGAQKSAALRGADLFVLPTFSESFGMAVAEALAYGLPVITTRGAPWADLPTHHCGWWIDIGVEPLAAAIREATVLSDAERRHMGERGSQYVRRYDWDVIAQQTLSFYRWLLQREEQPACVRLD
jgi:glycosyltransferase involved in cell wall biosynthesis